MTNSPTVLNTALRAIDRGFSIVPIKHDGTKRPDLSSWTEFQTRRPTTQEAIRWFRDNPQRGLGLVCGTASNNLELFEFDERETYRSFKELAIKAGFSNLIEKVETGFSEETPGGGFHWWYTCQDVEIPGNTQLARRPRLDEAGNPVLLENGRPDIKVLIETRGQGGQGVIAPSSGKVHPTGNPYKVLKGSIETIVNLTANERGALWDLAALFDEMPKTSIQQEKTFPQPTSRTSDDLKPGEEFNRKATWSEILEPVGWKYLYTHNGESFWKRPGKTTPGVSAKTGHIGRSGEEVFCNYSSSTEFEQKIGYNKFAVFTILYHNGDFTASAKALAAKGYGIQKHSSFVNFTGFNGAKIDPQTGEIQEENIKELIFKAHNLTDLGNARRLVERFGPYMRYVKAWGWLIYEKGRWQLDKTGAVDRYAKKTVQTIYIEAGQQEEVEKRKATADFAKKCEAKTRRDAMIEDAKSELEVVAEPENFDQKPMLLNCLNGTIDLKTGQLMPHDRNDLITKLAPVNFNPEAKCPTWLSFLDTIMAGKQDLIQFLQRAIGYSLTGDTTEHCLFFAYGNGRNGKSTLLETLAAMLGNYAQTSNFNTFLEREGDGPRNDIAKLTGSRFVSAVEADPGKRLAESVIKQLTGGDTISARFLFKEEFEYKPSFKIWLGANHKPVIRGQDLGIWRRIKLIPFEVTIPESSVDKKLPEKLRVELEGILTWAVKGCLDWQKEGLTEPSDVTAATEAYKEESDPIRDFLAERTLRGRNKSVEVKLCFKAYTTWCEEAGERPIGKQRFTQLLNERGIIVKPGHANKTTFYGISLAPAPKLQEVEKEPDPFEIDFWEVDNS